MVEIVSPKTRIFAYSLPGPDLVLLFAGLAVAGSVESILIRRAKTVDGGNVSVMYVFCSTEPVMGVLIDGCAAGECIEISKNKLVESVDKIIIERQNEQVVKKGLRGGGGIVA